MKRLCKKFRTSPSPAILPTPFCAPLWLSVVSLMNSVLGLHFCTNGAQPGRRAIGLSLATLIEIKKNIVVLVCSGQNPHCSTFVRTSRIIVHRCSVRFTGSVGWKPSIPKPVENVKILATCRSFSIFFHWRRHLLHIPQFVMLPRFVVQLLRLVTDIPVIVLLLSLPPRSSAGLQHHMPLQESACIPSTKSARWHCAESLLVLRHWWCACPRPSSDFLQMTASSPSYFLRSSTLPIHSHAHPNWCPSTFSRRLLQRNTNHFHFRSCLLLPSKSQHLHSASVQTTAGFSHKFEHNTRLPCPSVSRAYSPWSFHLGYVYWLPCSYPQTCTAPWTLLQIALQIAWQSLSTSGVSHLLYPTLACWWRCQLQLFEASIHRPLPDGRIQIALLRLGLTFLIAPSPSPSHRQSPLRGCPPRWTALALLRFCACSVPGNLQRFCPPNSLRPLANWTAPLFFTFASSSFPAEAALVLPACWQPIFL